MYYYVPKFYFGCYEDFIFLAEQERQNPLRVKKTEWHGDRPQSLLESDHLEFVVVVLLILMLKKLTELTERLSTFRTVIREIGNVIVVRIAVGDHGGISHEATHRWLILGKVVDLTACQILSSATRAISTFHVLDRIRPRLETGFAANGTRNITRTMNLHVHVQLVLIVELTETIRAPIDWGRAVARVFVVVSFNAVPAA